MEIGSFDKEMTAWFDYGRDAEIEIAFFPKDELTKLIKRHTRTTYKRGVQSTETDDERANIELGVKVVKNWKGLTQEGNEFPYSVDNCVELMRKDYNFSNFVNERCVEIDEFISRRDEAAIKKSEPAPSGGQKE